MAYTTGEGYCPTCDVDIVSCCILFVLCIIG